MVKSAKISYDFKRSGLIDEKFSYEKLSDKLGQTKTNSKIPTLPELKEGQAIIEVMEKEDQES
jgi:hypothetical protein